VQLPRGGTGARRPHAPRFWLDRHGRSLALSGIASQDAGSYIVFPLAMHQGSCHCGAVRLRLPSTPTVATKCNCSLCRRIGGPWVYFEFGSVQIEGHPEHTAAYVQGDRTLSTIHCRTCGCVTHWEPIPPTPGARHGVNLGNFDPALIASVRVRRFDGADTWTFLDE
jgi:hypothetical protein